MDIQVLMENYQNKRLLTTFWNQKLGLKEGRILSLSLWTKQAADLRNRLFRGYHCDRQEKFWLMAVPEALASVQRFECYYGYRISLLRNIRLLRTSQNQLYRANGRHSRSYIAMALYGRSLQLTSTMSLFTLEVWLLCDIMPTQV